GASGPATDLRGGVDELPPGRALLWPLGVAVVAVVGLVACSAAGPAWRAARRPVVDVLRHPELAAASRGARFPAGFLGLGMRLVGARRARARAPVAVRTVSAGG